jgi:glycosyltransferase involved in cell wall biosynthesis
MNIQSAAPLMVENYPSAYRSLRIALVTETFPPEVNGVALTVQRLVQGLQARHHDVQLVRPRQDRLELPSPEVGLEQVLTRGLPIPHYPHLRMGLPAKKSLQSMWTLRRPDLVHIATEGPLGWSALQAARKLKLPVCSDFRTNFHAYSRHYGFAWLHKPIAAYLRRFHNQAHCTMVPTPALQAQLQAVGFERLQVVARGVDARRFNPAQRDERLRHAWGAGPQDRVVLSVGRLAAEKNLDLLASAFAQMQALDTRLRLVVVGDGPERDKLQQRCPQALLVGVKHGDDLARHYASADLFLFPSQTETYGNVTPEAMASGLAVLAFDYAAATELIRHGHNGLLASFGDEEAFIRRACDLISHPLLVEQMRVSARHTAQSQDWDQIIDQVEGVWSRLLNWHANRMAGLIPAQSVFDPSAYTAI